MPSLPTPAPFRLFEQPAMSQPTPSLGRRLRWSLEYGAYVAVEKLFGLLTPREASLVGESLGEVAWMFSARHRRIVRRNLRIAFAGEKSPAEVDALVREVFRRSGANLFASLCTASLDAAALDRAVEVENPGALHALADGRGVIGVLSHMGNWEALAQKFPFMVPLGMPVANSYRRLSNPLLDARVVATRQRTGLRLFEKRASLFAMASFLRAGGGLGIISDQRASAIGETVPFFGRLTACTPQPAVLAKRTGAHVLGISVKTRAPGKWRIKLHPLKGEPTTAACMALLEEVMRESPADVFWLQDRWKVGAREPQFMPGKSPRDGDAGARPSKGRRCLVWLETGREDAPALHKVEPDDLVFEYSMPSAAPRPAWLKPDAVVHERKASTSRRRGAIAGEIARIDARADLPLDFVHAPRGTRKLAAACRRLGLPLLATVKPGK